MDSLTQNCRGETARHLRLKRLALIWAQAHGYSACALEVSLTRCRYRADVAAYRDLQCTAVFECKQAVVDLRRDNGSTLATELRHDAVYRRHRLMATLQRALYPALCM